MVANRETLDPTRTPKRHLKRDASDPMRSTKRRLKRAEYDLLVEHDAFEDERIELLFGEIYAMSPQKPPHSRVTSRLAEVLVLGLQGRAKVQSHSPIVGARESEPEPDIAVYDPRDDQTNDHPTHVHLVIEVMQSSRYRDLTLKRRLYALTRIPEYWVVEIARRCVRVMRDPSGDGYNTESTHSVTPGAVLSLLAFPDVTVALDDLFQGL